MNVKNKCPICQSEEMEYFEISGDKNINCKKCENYVIDDLMLSMLKDDDIKQYLPKISSWISEQNKIYGKRPEISPDTANKILEQKEKTIKEKFDCFMKTFAQISFPEDGLSFLEHLPYSKNKQKISMNEFNHCYINKDEFENIINKAEEKRYLKSAGISYCYKGLSFDGLEYIESLEEVNKNSKNVFVAFHFTHEMQSIFDNDIKSAIEELGLVYKRVGTSTTDTNTHINDEIIGKIKSAKIVIADFSGQRNSVYFEAGFAMGLKIPVIWTCKNDEVDDLSFDTRQYPHILWNAKEELAKKIKERILTLL
ncbi:MAG: hypothetical protein U5K55_13600 [Aliarcobacter sp.]|nr:hypothetical protein [Aliarcobacter sp.]